MNESDVLLEQFFDCLNQVAPYPSDDACCRILAWLLVYGGGREDVTINKRLNYDIRAAQKRLNLFGGEIPNSDLLPMYQQYARSVEDYDRPPEWVFELERKYNLKEGRVRCA
jgi:hypothetical protein